MAIATCPTTRSPPLSAPAERFGVLLLSASSARVHAALMLATTAAALGRDVLLFATEDGVAALRARDAAGREPAEEARRRSLGVATCAEMLAALGELGARLVACETALRLAGLGPADLAPGVEVAGMATLLGHGADVVSF